MLCLYFCDCYIRHTKMFVSRLCGLWATSSVSTSLVSSLAAFHISIPCRWWPQMPRLRYCTGRREALAKLHQPVNSSFLSTECNLGHCELVLQQGSSASHGHHPGDLACPRNPHSSHGFQYSSGHRLGAVLSHRFRQWPDPDGHWFRGCGVTSTTPGTLGG
jgi:hypothetical protein